MVVARGRCPLYLFRGRRTPLRTITIFKSKTITIELDCIFYTCKVRKVYKKPNVLNLQFKTPPPPNLFCSLCRGNFFPIYPFLSLHIPSYPSLVLYKYPSILSLNSLHIEHIPPISLPYSLHKPSHFPNPLHISSHSSLILYTYPPIFPLFSTHILPSNSLILYTYTLPFFSYSLHTPFHPSLILYTYPPILPLFSTHIPRSFPYSLHIPFHLSLILYTYTSILPLFYIHSLPSFPFSTHIPSHYSIYLDKYLDMLSVFSTHNLPSFPYSLNLPFIFDFPVFSTNTLPSFPCSLHIAFHHSHSLYIYPPIIPLF